MGKVLYMEIDLKNKELPTGRVGETMKELAEQCGKSHKTILSAMCRARKTGKPCKYIKVELED